jgi:hypothetical protein
VLNKERSAKQRECMFLDLVHWFLCTNIYGLSAGNREKKEKRRNAKELAEYSQSSARFGTPDSVRCARLNSGEQVALGRIWRRTTIIHQTVRWCTGLSGEPTVTSATAGREIRGRHVARANGRQGAPDCPVCDAAMVGCAILGRRSRTGHEQWMSDGAPDCPVRHPTEGKDSLPCWPPTAPSCLGTIKGTPKRVEELTKHTLSIPRLLVLTFTQSFIVLEIGALFEL